MTDAAAEDVDLSEVLAALHDLPERLAMAARALGIDQEESDAPSEADAGNEGQAGPDEEPPASSGTRIPHVFATARAAVAGFTWFVRGAEWPTTGAPRIVLLRRATGATVLVDSALSGPEAREAVAPFIADLRRSDERWQAVAELVGLLAGLCVRWAAAGFAPPVVLASLHHHGPRILELGRAPAMRAHSNGTMFGDRSSAHRGFFFVGED